jgi:hypothetical protein
MHVNIIELVIHFSAKQHTQLYNAQLQWLSSAS